MKNRTIAVLVLGLGIVLTYLLFPRLFDVGAYALPIAQLAIYYDGADPSELPYNIVVRLVDPGVKIFGYAAGIFLGILPLLISYIIYKKFMAMADELNEESTRISRHPMQFCFALLLFFISLSGFFFVGPKQHAVAMEYEIGDLIPDSWGKVIAIKDGRILTDSVRFVDKPILEIFGRKLYWNYPFPFGSVLKINLEEEFLVHAPLIKQIPVYLYDDDGNIVDVRRDSLGNIVALGYEFWTTEGKKFYSTNTWTELIYSQDFTLDVVTIDVEGIYEVIDIFQYGSFEIGAFQATEIFVNELGYYAELVDPMTAKETIEKSLLASLLQQYMFQLKLPALVTMYNPYMEEDEVVKSIIRMLEVSPTLAIEGLELSTIGTIPSFLEFIRTYPIIEDLNLNTEEYFGIMISNNMIANVYEFPF